MLECAKYFTGSLIYPSQLLYEFIITVVILHLTDLKKISVLCRARQSVAGPGFEL